MHQVDTLVAPCPLHCTRLGLGEFA